MSKYENIANTRWSKITLLSESVPHLFHWDLCYLWMLEKVLDEKKSNVPQAWRTRLESWEHLVALFFDGRVEVVSQRIQEPLLNYTSIYGIESVSWLQSSDGQTLGVLSPTVIARPLPDSDLQADDWPEKPNLDSDEIKHFVSLAVQDLKNTNGGFGERLIPILRDRFDPDRTVGNSDSMHGRSVTVPMLEHLQWGKPAENAVDTVDLLVRQPSGGDPTYVPTCPEEGEPLLRKSREDPIQVSPGRTAFNVECPHCDQGPHEVELEELLVWQRKRGRNGDPEVVVWKKSSWISDTPDDGFPPSPTIKGTRVEFEWNPAQVEGNRQRRFLKLRFTGRSVHKESPDEIMYDHLLVPGDAMSYEGLPVRHEWFDALKDTNLDKSINTEKRRVTYDNIKLHGWPIPIGRTFDKHRTEFRPEAGVGKFPNPSGVPRGWSWYRFFVTGKDRRTFEVKTSDSKGTGPLSWVATSDDGLPEYISVEKADGPTKRTGVSYVTDFAGSVESDQDQFEIGDESLKVGVDFGTTNTLIYAFHGGAGQTEVDLNADLNGISPGQVYEQIEWLAPETDDAPAGRHAADFLPRPEIEGKGSDPYLIPSSIWSTGGKHIVRWNQEPPVDQANAVTNFKLDRGRSFDTERKEYLVELLSLYIPAMLSEAYEGLGPGSIGKIELGFAYPLALGYSERNQMKSLLDTVAERLSQRTGLRLGIGSISESMACVRAFGAFNPGRTFLIADMGGGTMDVSLLTIKREDTNDIHQIGSLRFAGERFLEILTSRSNQHNLWEIRDAIRSGESQSRYANDEEIDRLFQAFVACALEFLRTMGKAFCVNHSDKEFPDLILVGNGWHLIEAFSEEAANVGPKYFENQYNRFTTQMGVEGSLYQEGMVSNLPSSKHLVVLGALTNAISGGNRNELDDIGDEVVRPRLPAGRSMHLSREGEFEIKLTWSDLLGEGAEIGNTLRGAQLETCTIDFDLADFPELPDVWADRLCDALGAESVQNLPYLPEEKLRDQIQKGIKTTDTPRIEKGPLQIILEQGWTQHLRRK